MTRWLLAFVIGGGVALVVSARLRHFAFSKGWFERSGQTQRRRSERRPTHGGFAAATAVAAVGLVAGPAEPIGRVFVALGVIGAGAAWADRKGDQRWAVRAATFGSAAAVALAGSPATLTGDGAVDRLLTALLVVVVIRGLEALDTSEGVLVVVVAVCGAALLAASAKVVEPSVTAAAAGTVGIAGALATRMLAPADLRFGRCGASVLGGALAATIIAHQPAVPSPDSFVVPLALLAVPGLAVVVGGWDLRLSARHLPPAIVLPLACAVGGAAAYAIEAGWVGSRAGLAIAAGTALLTALVAWTTHRPASLGPRRPWVLPLGAVVVVVAAGVAALAFAALDQARSSLELGRDAAETGLSAARDGDLDTARTAFERADANFTEARDRLASPVVRLGLLVPVVAQNVRAAQEIADVGHDLAGTAVSVAARAGADDLRVVEGRFPIEAAREVGEQLSAARGTLADAHARLSVIGSPWLVGEVDEVVDRLRERVAEADASIEVAAEATRLAPQLLGGDGERRWFVAILAPAELRGAGGLMGDYALLRASDGNLDLELTAPTSELNATTDDDAMRAALPPIYGQEFQPFRAHEFWQNLSVTPDIPTIGEAVTAAFPLSGQGEVDGLMTIDPLGLAGLLDLTGPVRVANWPDPITAGNVAEILLFEQYDQLTDAELDRFQGDVVNAVVDELTTGSLPAPSAVAAVLAPAVAGGHLRLWSPNAEEEALFERMGADGGQARPDADDHLELVTQNGGENKIDYFLRRSVDYQVSWDPRTGDTTAVATVTIENQAPARDVNSVIIGGEDGSPTAAGENRIFVTIRTPLEVTGVTDAAGTPMAADLGEQAGMRTVTVVLRIPAESTQTVRLELAGRLAGGPDYRLQLGRQPTGFADEITVSALGATQVVTLDQPTEIVIPTGD